MWDKVCHRARNIQIMCLSRTKTLWTFQTVNKCTYCDRKYAASNVTRLLCQPDTVYTTGNSGHHTCSQHISKLPLHASRIPSMWGKKNTSVAVWRNEDGGMTQRLICRDSFGRTERPMKSRTGATIILFRQNVSFCWILVACARVNAWIECQLVAALCPFTASVSTCSTYPCDGSNRSGQSSP
jgi:hypothetical protein